MFCTHCGTRYVKETWPKGCHSCGKVAYQNPTPVAVGLVPVVLRQNRKRVGVLIEKRGIEPKHGEWALPGGFVELGESVAEAVSREVLEEVGQHVPPGPMKYVLDVNISGRLLIFMITSLLFIDEKDITEFTPTSEVLAIDVCYEPRDLCFPTHTDALSLGLMEIKRSVWTP